MECLISVKKECSQLSAAAMIVVLLFETTYWYVMK